MDVSVIMFGLLLLHVLISSVKCGNGNVWPVASPITYTLGYLHALRAQPSCQGAHLPSNAVIPPELRRRKRGKAGGVKKRLRRQKARPYLPAIVMGNVQSLNNKIDELSANVKYLQEFRNASLMSFIETWLSEIHQDTHVSINGFKLLRGDRTVELRKKSGGGVCVYINERWCHPNNAVIKRYSCSENLEILTVSLRPYYLPREFSHVVMSTVYVPHKNVAKEAALELTEVIHDLEQAAPASLMLINGDFNHCTLGKSSVIKTSHVQPVAKQPWICDIPMSRTPILLFNCRSWEDLIII